MGGDGAERGGEGEREGKRKRKEERGMEGKGDTLLHQSIHTQT